MRDGNGFGLAGALAAIINDHRATGRVEERQIRAAERLLEAYRHAGGAVDFDPIAAEMRRFKAAGK